MNFIAKTLALVALAPIATLALACKDEGGSAATAGGERDPDAPIRIVYIPKNTGNPYFDAVVTGFEDASKELGADFTTVAPATADATSQLPIIKAQVQQGVDVLAISPNSPDALVPALKQARDRGIVVLTVDADTTGNPDARDLTVATADKAMVGEGQVELLGSLIDYSGKFAILSATTDAPNQNEWIDEMGKVLAGEKYADMELVEIAYGNDEPQKSLTEAEALLSKYPDLKGIIAPTTVGIVAAAQAVESAGKVDAVKVTGLGTPNQMREFVKSGTVEAFQLWSPRDEGYLAAHLGHALVVGDLKADEGQTATAGELGDRDIGPDGIVITGPPTTFNADNIDDFDF